MSRYGQLLYELLELITGMGIFRGRNLAKLNHAHHQNPHLRARMMYDTRKRLIMTDWHETSF